SVVSTFTVFSILLSVTYSPIPPSPPLFFFNDTAPTEIYTLSLHDALPIYSSAFGKCRAHIRSHCLDRSSCAQSLWSDRQTSAACLYPYRTVVNPAGIWLCCISYTRSLGQECRSAFAEYGKHYCCARRHRSASTRDQLRAGGAGPSTFGERCGCCARTIGRTKGD